MLGLLNEELRNKAEDKLKEIREAIALKCSPIIQKIKDEESSIDKILNDISSLEKQVKLLDYNFKIVIDEFPDYNNLKGWFQKV